MENLKRYIRNFGFNRETIIPLVISIVVFSTMFNQHLQGVLWIIDATFFAVLLLYTMMIAGYAVMEALVKVSAGLTLIIFLAQTYCALPVSSQSNIEALKGVFGIVLLCLIFDFFRSLYKAFELNWVKAKGDKWSFKGVTTIVLLILFTGLFISWIYQIMDPILHSLCLYK